MSAAGTATPRRKSAMPGRTNTPRPTSPITGSQQYTAAGLAARTRATACTTACPMSAEPRYPERTASQLPRTPRSAMPSTTSSTACPSKTRPRQAPYPVWLENCTVCTGQTSMPSRCSGKTADAFPACPYATWDWMERTFTVTHRRTHAGDRSRGRGARVVTGAAQPDGLPLLAVSRPPRDGAGRNLPPRLDPRAGRSRHGEAEPAQTRPRGGGRAQTRPPVSGRRRLVRATRIIAAVVSFLVLAGSGYGWAAYRSFASGVRHVDAIGSSGVDKDGPAQNILLVGDDSRPANASPAVLAQLSTEEDGGSTNTDTVMLLRIPSGGGKATVISFPRDSWVDIPGHGKGKLNSAFAYGAAHGGGDAGGMKQLISVVQNLSGLHVDHFVKVSLLGF